MRTLFYSLVLIAIAAFPLTSLAADSTAASVNSHLAAISWLSGTFKCVGQTTYSDGKTEKDNVTLIISKPQNGWIVGKAKGQPGATYFGYDPKKDKYVGISAGSSPGSYGAGYFTVASDRSITFVYPDLFDNDVTSGSDAKLTPTANGYIFTATGPSDQYPGKRFKSSDTCTRQ